MIRFTFRRQVGAVSFILPLVRLDTAARFGQEPKIGAFIGRLFRVQKWTGSTRYSDFTSAVTQALGIGACRVG